MPVLVLTVIGDDRVGLVETLADTVSTHGGNWERSQMAELAGKFAGIVVVTVPADRTTDLSDALRTLDGLLEVSAHSGTDAAADQRSWTQLTLDLSGNDHPRHRPRRVGRAEPARAEHRDDHHGRSRRADGRRDDL